MPRAAAVSGCLALIALTAIWKQRRRRRVPAQAPPAPRPGGIKRLVRYLAPVETLQMGVGLAFAAGYSWSTCDLTRDMEMLLQSSQAAGGVPSNIGALTIRFLQRTCISEFFNLGYLLCIKMCAQRLVMRLRQEVFRALINKDPEFFDTRQTGSLLNMLSEGANKAVNLPECLARAVTHLFFIGRGLAVMLRFSTTGNRSRMGRLALELLGIMAATSVFVVATRPRTKARDQRLQKFLNDAAGFAGERLTGVRTVQAFHQQQAEAAAYNDKVETVFNCEVHKVSIYALQQIVIHGVGYLGAARILFTCSAMVSEGTLTVGGLIAFVSRSLLLVLGIRGLLDVSRKLGETSTATAALFAILDDRQHRQTQGVHRPAALKGRILFEDVSFRYPSRPSDTVLEHFSLAIPAGAKLAIVGSSGCGKTTVAMMLLRLYAPCSGKVLVDGQDIDDLHPEWLRQGIGYVPQEPSLFAGTIEENIRYGTDADRAQVQAAALKASADGFISAMPDGYGTKVGDMTLSGGQKQRIAIARALIRNPSILILDEATSCLDSENEAQVQSAINRLVATSAADSMTVIMIGHRWSSLAMADEVVVLSGGCVVERGSYEQLQAKDGSHLRRLLG